MFNFGGDRRACRLRLLVLSLLGAPINYPALAKQLITFAFFAVIGFTMGRKIGAITETKILKWNLLASEKPPATVEIEAPACLICQVPVGSPSPEGTIERWSLLPCGHRFGSHCIKRYLGIVADERPSCPICRLPAHHQCDHPVLPLVLDARDSKSETDMPAKERTLGIEKLQASLCGYCRTLEAKEKRSRKPSARWKTPIRWMWRLRLTTCRRSRSRDGRDDDGIWRGPWVDKWPRERDPGWEKWWESQAPCGA